MLGCYNSRKLFEISGYNHESPLMIGVTAHSHDFLLRTGKEIRFRFWLSEDKAGKEAKRRTTGW